MARPRNLLPIHHPDQGQDRERRAFAEKVTELESRAPRRVVIRDLELPDGVPVDVPHRLGVRPMVKTSPVRDASSTGRISELRPDSRDPRRFVVLQADGFGATVRVDVELTA